MTEVTDNRTVAEETVIYTSVSAKVTMVLLLLFMAGTGFYWLFRGHRTFIAVLCFSGAGLFTFQLIKLLPKVPRLTLNAEGITTETAGFRSWGDISEEGTEKVRENKSDICYLTYQYEGNTERQSLTTLDIKMEQLDDLLAAYRSRYEENNNRRKRF